MLQTAGFATARSMEGGIHAWQGLTAAGAPEAGMSFFTPAASAEELIALAWLLEEGSREFYAAQAAASKDGRVSRLFHDLVDAEQHHKTSLEGLFRELTGRAPEFPAGGLAPDGPRMEGAVKVNEALAWAEGKEGRAVLELSMELEADSYDLYIKMGRHAAGDKGKKVFELLIREEKEHLARMAAVMDALA